MTGPVHVRHLPTEAEAFPYDGTNDAEIADSLGDLAYIEAGHVVLRTPQGDISPDPTNVVIFDRRHHEVYPITAARYATNWAPVGEGS